MVTIGKRLFPFFLTKISNIFAVMDPLPLPVFKLKFDGATRRGINPEIGGAAAIIEIDDNRENDVRVWNRMGFVGRICAEYYGLILGLRELLHLSPTSAFSLVIRGDSELVLKQLKGEYQVDDKKVVSNYFVVALGLLETIRNKIEAAPGEGYLELEHVPRNQNEETYALAAKAAGMQVTPRFRFFHYPALCMFLKGRFYGTNIDVQIPVAHNFGAAAFTPEVYIDAGFLCSVSGYQSLKDIRSTGKKNLIEGQANMTILGTASVKFTFGHGMIVVEDAYVVDFLPWPLQISAQHPAIENEKIFGEDNEIRVRSYRDWRSHTPERHRSHPYWTHDTNVRHYAVAFE